VDHRSNTLIDILRNHYNDALSMSNRRSPTSRSAK